MQHINKIKQGIDLTKEEMSQIFYDIFDNDAPDEDVASFLLALRDKGETAAELAGAAAFIRNKAHFIHAPETALDCCGTGGDGAHSLNISTAVSFVVAACGVPVAKHGNRAASSKSGAADVLEALGVNLDIPQETHEKLLRDINITFMMATHHHPALKKVSAVRKKLATRTIFNLLGPLSNPARVKRQLLGVFDASWVVPMCEALKDIGHTKAWVVHGHDGLDEITLFDKTSVAALDNGVITQFDINPADYGFDIHDPTSIAGGDAVYNAQAIRDLFDGKTGGYHDMVCLNAAACLVIADKAATLEQGIDMAKDVIKNGVAKKTLNDFIIGTQI